MVSIAIKAQQLLHQDSRPPTVPVVRIGSLVADVLVQRDPVGVLAAADRGSVRQVRAIPRAAVDRDAGIMLVETTVRLMEPESVDGVPIDHAHNAEKHVDLQRSLVGKQEVHAYPRRRLLALALAQRRPRPLEDHRTHGHLHAVVFDAA